MTAPAGRGVWLGASHVLGWPVPVDEPYPHICGASLVGLMTARGVRLSWRDCAGCAAQSRQVVSDRPQAAA